MNDVFSYFYEFFYISVPFSDDIYESGLYSLLGLCAAFISLVLVLVFYYVINRPSFSRWYHWLLILGVNFLIAFIIGFAIPKNELSGLGIEHEHEYYLLALVNGVIASFAFAILSSLLRWWSTNAKGTPIPH